MRPLRLELCCFGTYYKRTEINLEELGNNGLYLITGDTGSGKTTIFDAISYALFDVPSGNERTGSMFRSTMATLEDETYVILEFEHFGKKYTIKREPSYERKAKKGDGIIQSQPTASIVSENMDPIVGTTKVNDFVRDLLCLDKSQFSQIAMIAQGDFQKILFLETKDRIPVFRKLFKTEKYEILEKKLAEKTSELNNQLKLLSNDLNIYINSICCPEDNVLSIDFDKAKKGLLPKTEVIEILQKLIAEEESESKELQKASNKNNEKCIENTKKLAAILKKEAQQQDVIQKGSQLQEAKVNLVEAENAFNTQKEKQKDKKDKENTLAVLKEKMGQYEVLEDKQKDLKTKENLLNEKQTVLENKTEKHEEINEKIKELKEEQLKYENAETLLLKNKTDISEKEVLISQIKDFLKNTDSFAATKASYEESKTVLQTALEEEQKKSARETELRTLFYQNQAGIMAENLEEGSPCPVCGAVHHIAKAHKSPEAPTQVMVEAAEKEAKSAKDASTKCFQKNAGLKSDVENLKNNLETAFSNLALSDKPSFSEENLAVVSDFLKQQGTVVAKECDNLRTVILELEKQAERKEFLKKDIPAKETELNTLAAEKNQLIQEISVITEQINNLQDGIKEISNSLEYETKTIAEEKVSALTKEIKQLEEVYELADAKVKNCVSEINKLEGQISSLKEQCGDFSLEEKQKLQEEEKLLASEKELLDNKITDNHHYLENNKTALNNINENAQQVIQVESKFQVVSALSKTANGTIGGGKYKIQLETYVQMTFLDKVIALANKRLAIMSDGQYDLIRKADGDKQNQSGLDINVIDHYEGGERSVKSLSGGESFEASLSLALGLSDVIANYAGGIKIDTMFIDEGFGTLDTDTLQKAFKALSSISEGNNKLIGIISHVDLLKEKVTKQIRVTKKTCEGSSVQIIS